MTMEFGPDKPAQFIDAKIGGIVLQLLEERDATTVRGLVYANVDHFTAVNEQQPELFATLEKTREWILGKQNDEGVLRHTKYGIITGETMVGCIGYRKNTPTLASIWYFIGGEYVRNGHGMAAVRTMKFHLFQLGFSAVQAFIRPENTASIKLAQGALFTRDGGMRYGDHGEFERYVAYDRGIYASGL